MTQRDRRVLASTAAAAALAVAFVLATACTESKVVRSGVANTVLTFQATFTTPTAFDSGSIGFGQIIIAPADPDAHAALGSSIGLLASPAVFDPLGPGIQIPGIPLAPQAYVLESLEFRMPTFVNTDPSTDPADPCLDKVAGLPGSMPGLFNQYPDVVSLDFTQDPDPPTFVISEGDNTPIFIRIDFDAMLPEYLSRFVCTETLRCSLSGVPGDTEPPPCIQFFQDIAGFTDIIKGAIEID